MGCNASPPSNFAATVAYAVRLYGEFGLNAELVSFDLENDLLMALENLESTLIKVKLGNTKYLKWCLIYGHTALQTAMCLSLVPSGSFLIRKKESYDKDYGDLDNVEWLYKKLKRTDILAFMGSKAIPHVENELEQVKRLQVVRNTFIHQQSSLYVFTSEELLELILLTVNLTRFLVSKSERMSFGAYVSKTNVEHQLSSVELLLAKPSCFAN